MKSRVARFLGSLMPSRYPVASAPEHSTRLELWTEVIARPRQRLQPSPSGPAAGPLLASPSCNVSFAAARMCAPRPTGDASA